MKRLIHWWTSHRRHPRCNLICTCQIRGYVWYADGKVWALSPEDVEVITDDRRR